MERRGRVSKPRGTRVPRSAARGRDLNRDPDEFMAISSSSVGRIMQRLLPDKASVDDDAKEAVQKCATEFISFITREANKRCHQDYRNTVTADDVIAAMAALGFRDYVGPLVAFINKHRALDPSASHTVMQLPQLPTQVAYLPPPPPPPPPPLPPSVGDCYVPSPPLDIGDYFGVPEIIRYNSMDTFDGGQGSSNDMEFDPFR